MEHAYADKTRKVVEKMAEHFASNLADNYCELIRIEETTGNFGNKYFKVQCHPDIYTPFRASLALMKFTDELEKDKFGSSNTTMLDQEAAVAPFDAKYIKFFHEDFNKLFKWRVPGTMIGEKELEIPANELPAELVFKL